MEFIDKFQTRINIFEDHFYDVFFIKVSLEYLLFFLKDSLNVAKYTLSWFPILINDALDFLQKLFTRAVLAILKGDNSKKFLTRRPQCLDIKIFGLLISN